ncbi:hypothetical protein [Sutterella sp.]|nr:hypothetical protein [Sutterella sp.]MDO5531236.1 hypothetical protein [Sutterella sp.]
MQNVKRFLESFSGAGADELGAARDLVALARESGQLSAIRACVPSNAT